MKKLLLIAATTTTVASGAWANEYTISRVGTSGGSSTAFVEFNIPFGDGIGLIQFSYDGTTWTNDQTTADAEWHRNGIRPQDIAQHINTLPVPNLSLIHI